QAIYGFRGADVHAYLDAARAAGADHQLTLAENWRADGALVDALHALLWPLRLGDSEIRYEKPLTPGALRGQRMVLGAEQGRSAPHMRPLRLRLVDHDAPELVPTKEHLVTKRSAQLWVATDLATDISRLLASGVRLPGADRPTRAIGPRRGTDGPGTDRPLSAGDIGVLVRTNRQAVIVQDALRLRGVPVVVAGAQSVLSTVSAQHWLQLLSALEQPSSRSSAVAVALSDFIGLSAGQLAQAPDARWEDLHERLHEWSAVARAKGVATLFSHIAAQTQLPVRLLETAEGERRLTDLAHVSELLHAEARRHQLGLAALRAWLARHVEDQVGEGVDAEQRARRLDSDADAVQVLTVHRAKGLEFPIVYCPFAWDGTAVERAGGPIVFHENEGGGARKLDVGGDGQSPAYKQHYRAYQAERRGEELRHLYVALTRARHQVVIWWAPVRDCQHSALGRVLFSRDAHGEVSASGLRSAPRHDAVRQRFDAVAAAAPGLVSVEAPRWQPVVEHLAAQAEDDHVASAERERRAAALSAAVLGRDFDQSWQRASYSGMVAEAATRARVGDRAPLVSSEPEASVLADEPMPQVVPTEWAALGEAVPGHPWEVAPVPLGPVPSGAEVGTLVHSVLEAVDFTERPLRAAISTALQVATTRYAGPVLPSEGLVEGLAAALDAPLGGPLAGFALSSLLRKDRVDELRFEMPLAGGDRPRGTVKVDALAEVLGRYLPAGSPLSGYPDHLRGLGPQALRGYLTGSLDLVFRACTPGGDARYFVADYKTNRLAGKDETLVYGHYRADALAAAMVHSHYVLQALFYLVALHRYLSWRLPGYRPDVHLGGAAYLFLRGMGPSVAGAPAGAGVFWWCPPVGLVEEVSALLASPASGPREPQC
ncbi:MAG TPA: 3'-5' exonuclease, partial [Acidimicrobiales bacterium]|nr:3'-5' exonuclease [Acidimicrobiales bacterium]